jgi:hypothetical protein
MLAWNLLLWFRENHIIARAVHLKGTLNVEADRLSRVFVSPTPQPENSVTPTPKNDVNHLRTPYYSAKNGN